MKLRELRKTQNLTQKELADILNIKNTTYSNWECGVAQPDIASLLKLADFFQCSVDYLLGRENEDGIIVMQTDADLSAEELELVQNFRQLNAGAQAELKGFVRGLLTAPMLTRKNKSA